MCGLALCPNNPSEPAPSARAERRQRRQIGFYVALVALLAQSMDGWVGFNAIHRLKPGFVVDRAIIVWDLQPVEKTAQ
tara:strand:+ start:565 stop:798 length:234 start_codon:yes stop_codon:yes gene_type:complete